MKTLYATPELLDLLQENGIAMICNEEMEVKIDDNDVDKIDNIIKTFAPYAISDYTIED